jgi:hypothetical protein
MQITNKCTNEEICHDIIRFYVEDSIHEERQNDASIENERLARSVEKHRDERLINFITDLDQYSLLPMRVDTIDTAINNQPDGDYFVAVVDARYSNNEFKNPTWEEVDSYTLSNAEYDRILNAYGETTVLPLKAILFTNK